MSILVETTLVLYISMCCQELKTNEWGVTDEGYKISFGDEKNVPELLSDNCRTW